MSTALQNPQLISLAAGFVDHQTLPVESVRGVLAELMADPVAARAALQYGATAGLPALREAIIERFTADFPTPPRIERVVITAGSNQLLHLVAESLLDPGDIVLCAAPTYLVFVGTVANLDARTFGVGTDEQGMIPAALEEALTRLSARGDLPRVKAIYLVPYFDNPSGVTMPVARVAEIIEIARRWSRGTRIHVIADEAYRELRYAGDDVPSAGAIDTEADTVIVAGTFSKSFSPGVRVGWGILPDHLIEPVCAQKGNIDFGSPHLNQHVMARVLNQGWFDQQVGRLRENYSRKLSAMLAAAEEFLGPIEGVRWARPMGGLYVWTRLPERIPTGPPGKLFDRAVHEGVLYVPGQYCYPPEGQPVGSSTMRLSFGVQPCERIREGIQALARAIQAVA